MPFYTLCETTKLKPKPLSKELEEGFDLIPPALITGIVTEMGLIKPAEVSDYMKERRSTFKFIDACRILKCHL